MGRLAVLAGLALLLAAGHAEAQWKYTDDKGVGKVAQYKLDIPSRYRDGAVWAGPTGIGRPALSKEQREAQQRDDAYRRPGQSQADLMRHRPTVWGALPRERKSPAPCTP